MSRTIRRKNASWNQKQWYFYNYEYINSVFERRYFEKNTIEYKRAYHHYHGDRKTFGSGVPHDYVNINHERPFRRENKIKVKQWMDNPEKEVMFNKYIRDAGWHYW